MLAIAPASNRGQLILQCLLLGSAYFLGGFAIDLLEIDDGASILFWPSAGVALSAIVILGYRVWPGVALGQLALSYYHSADWQMVVFLIPGAVLQSIVGAELILRRRGMHPEIRNVRNAIWFIMVAVIACSFVSSTFASVGKLIAGHFGSAGAFINNWWQWAMGDALGIIVFYPFLMNWMPHAGARQDYHPMNRAQWLALASIVLVAAIVYDPFGVFGQEVKAMAFLPLPILMWVALRYGMRMGTLNLVLVVGLIVWGASMNNSIVLLVSPSERILIVAGFAFMMALATLVAAASAEEYREAQSAMEESEVLSRRILETTPNVIYVFDLVGKHNVYSNQKITELLGYSPSEIQKMGDEFLTALLHPDDVAKLPELLSRWDHASDADLFTTEYRMKDAQGNWHWFAATDAVFKRDDEGKVIQIIGNARDITEMRLAREQAQLDNSFNKSIIANAGEGICVCTEVPEFPFVRFSVWNEQMVSITGYTMEEINELGWYQSLYPDPAVQTAAIARMQRMRDGDNLAGEEWEITRKDGGKRQILITTSIVMSKDGIPNVLGVMSDITARKESAAALKRLESLYRQAITAANAVPYMQDHLTGEFSFMGEGIEQLTGYTSDEMNRKLWDDIAEMSLLHGEDSEMSIKEAIQHARAGKMTQWQCDTMIVTKSGEKRWISDCAVEIPGDDGKPTGSIGILMDITGRKKAEEALRDSEARFRAFLDNSPAIAFMKDQEGRYVVGNNAWADQFGRSVEELIGKTDYDLWDEETAETFRKSDQEALRAGGNISRIERVRNADGSERWLSVLKFTVPRMGADDLIGGISMDVTEQKKAEEQVQQLNTELEDRVRERTNELKRRVEDVERLNAGMVNLLEDLQNARRVSDENAAKLESANYQLQAINQELEAFSYSISHDLRAPLRHIHGFIRLLQDEAKEKLSEKGQHQMQTVAESATRMGQLIDDLLEFSRSGRSELKRENIDLNSLVQEVVREFEAETKRNEIEWKITPLPAVMGDRNLLRQVFYNLISNAVKYTSKSANPVIEIGSERVAQPKMKGLYVRDNGAGFDMQYADKLFGVFQRLHRRDEFEGTGIGLANVRRILHRHGGQIYAEAKINEGAAFHFTLPTAANPGNQKPDSEL